jgi:hypothetical protein
MPLLVLGPLLRYVGETEATIWVETDQACEVSILGTTTRTFEVENHHYGLLYVKDLEPNSTTAYDVSLDGEKVWPEANDPFPQPVIRTPKDDDHVKMVWGSCRVAAPHEPPFCLRKDEDPRGRGIDSLYAYALRMLDQPQNEWPHVAMLLGDQVYADEVSPKTREFIRTRRDHQSGPGEQIADFEEYCHMYQESWRDPVIRWLFSTVSTAMIWDDHDVHDDWNASQDWLDQIRSKDWWNDRIVGAIMSYWLYQHWGNLSPRELDDDELFCKVCEADGDAGPIIREFAFKSDRQVEGVRWSFCRDIGSTRIIVMDSRGGRVLDPDNRKMVDDEEWEWIVEHATSGGYSHLILASTLPILLPESMHWLEAWNEATAQGAWGGRFMRRAEWIRQELDLEHWAAFQNSFHRVVGLVRDLGSGKHGEIPESIVFLSGDVHNAYLANVAFPRDANVQCPVWQGVCSPFRNPLSAQEQRAVKFSSSKPFGAVMKRMAKRAGVKDPGIRWKMEKGPAFDNQVATMEWNGPGARMTLERAEPGEPLKPKLTISFEHELAAQDMGTEKTVASLQA